jgi:hypothetical protein
MLRYAEMWGLGMYMDIYGCMGCLGLRDVDCLDGFRVEGFRMV